jgi:hypothetical protein
MSEIDTLVEAAKTLKGARSLAEQCSDRTLLYFIDMAIFQVCETLSAVENVEAPAEAPHSDFSCASP